MPAADLAQRVKRLASIRSSALAALLDPEGERHWGAHEENTARLYDLLRWQGGLEWADRTVDPDEARRQAAASKRAGLRPPEQPLIPPVALRPKGLTEARLEAYLAEVARFSLPAKAGRTVGRAEFDQAYGLT